MHAVHREGKYVCEQKVVLVTGSNSFLTFARTQVKSRGITPANISSNLLGITGRSDILVLLGPLGEEEDIILG